ncbi:MAG: accessory gene regulator B family protein [Lachnospiraceae bacterium]
MNSISCKFVDYLIENEILPLKMKEGYVYSFEVLFGKILNYSTLLVLGFINQNIIHTIFFMVAFLSLRGRTGGYHAPKKFLCYVWTIVIYYFVSEISEHLLFGNTEVLIGTVVISVIIIFLFSPVNHPNLELSKQEIQVCKSFSRWLAILISLIVFISVQLDIIPEYIPYSVAGMGMDAGLLILAKILKQEVPKDEKFERKNYERYC